MDAGSRGLRFAVLASLVGFSSVELAVVAGSELFKYVVALLAGAGCVALVSYCFSVRKLFLRSVVKEVYLLYLVFIFFCILVVCRSISFDVRGLTDLFFLPLNAPAWIAPLFFMVGVVSKGWHEFMRLWPRLVLVGLCGVAAGSVLDSSTGRVSEIFATSFLFFCFPILLLFPFYSRASRLLAMMGVCVWVFVAIVAYRRYMLLVLFLFFVAFVFMVFRNRKYYVRHFIGMIWVAVGAALAAFVLSVFVESSVLVSSVDEGLNALADKGLDNSREGFWDDFSGDLTSLDIAFGRGALGTYRSGVVNVIVDGVAIDGARGVVEIGWMHFILKGGVIVLALFALMSLKGVAAVLKGGSAVYQVCGLLVLIRLLMMLIYAIPIYNGEYLLYWASLGYLYRNRVVV